MMNNNSSLEKQLRTLRKRSTFTLFLTWMALFFTVVGIAAGYKNFLRVHDKAKVAQESALSIASLAPSYALRESVESWQQEVTSKLTTSSAQAAAELDELKAVRESNLFITEALNKQVEQMTLQQKRRRLRLPGGPGRGRVLPRRGENGVSARRAKNGGIKNVFFKLK